MSQTDLSKLEFWAKTTEDKLPGISVLHHMINVGMVAENLVKNYARLLKHFNLYAQDVALLAALHDIGKNFSRFPKQVRQVAGTKYNEGHLYCTGLAKLQDTS